MPYTDIRDGLVHGGPPRILHQNDSQETRHVAMPPPPLNDTFTALQFTVPPGHTLYADGTVRRSEHFYGRPPRTTTTPEENTAMPNTPVTTVDEAAAALAQFQEAMAREAANNGHPREFGEWITRAIAEIPGLRAAPNPEFHPEGNLHLTIRMVIPGANPAAGRDTIHDTFTREVRQWADENGHATLTGDQKFVAYALAHPEIFDLASAQTNGYLDTYSVTTRRNQGATTGRVEFVRD